MPRRRLVSDFSERRKLLSITRYAHARRVATLIRRVGQLVDFIGKDVSMAAARRVASERPCVWQNYFRSRVALTFKFRGANLTRWEMELVYRFAEIGLRCTAPILMFGPVGPLLIC